MNNVNNTQKNVEKKIWQLEGFDVAITQNGKDVRGDKSNFKQWDGQRQTRNDSTVADFVKKFEGKYPGYSVKVFHPNSESSLNAHPTNGI